MLRSMIRRFGTGHVVIPLDGYGEGSSEAPWRVDEREIWDVAPVLKQFFSVKDEHVCLEV